MIFNNHFLVSYPASCFIFLITFVRFKSPFSTYDIYSLQEGWAHPIYWAGHSHAHGLGKTEAAHSWQSSVSHLSQASTIPIYCVCLRSRSERQLTINAALSVESKPSLCTTQVSCSKVKWREWGICANEKKAYNNEEWCVLLLSPSSEPSYARDINYQNTLKYFSNLTYWFHYPWWRKISLIYKWRKLIQLYVLPRCEIFLEQ